ncbi:MAG TPA: fructosamine kinase family protein [Puia sp.]|nr:fructosamine kinase family protein [Puia sp.]
MDPGVTQMFIRNLLSQQSGILPASFEFRAVGGGSINDTFIITCDRQQAFFCKINWAKKFPYLFIKEKNGLELLAKQKIFRIPAVIAVEENEDRQVIILEYIQQGLRTKKFWQLFGKQLAALHLVSNDCFGLDEDNYMGASAQINTLSENWMDFFVHKRLEPQIKLAADHNLLEGKHIRQFQKLYQFLHEIFPEEKPSLLHGDLWSGNFLCDENSSPVLIDPAVYYGNRHIDLAMTGLFGGFDYGFYEAYDYYSPLPQNHRQIWDICNLYPLLIHLNLFGSGYLSEILQTINKY